MRVGLSCSIAIHATLLVAAAIGWPTETRPLIQHSPDVPIEIVRFDELSNPPPGKKPDPRDERKPDDDETKSKNQSAEGGKTEPRSTERKPKLPDKPATKPEPPKTALKEAPKAAETEATPKTDKTEIAAPKRPDTSPEPPKPEVREAPSATARPDAPARPERETAMPKRPDTLPEPPKPEVRNVPSPTARPDDVAKPDRETAAPKRPTAAPKIEQDEAALRAPPKPAPREDTKTEIVPRPSVRPTFRPEPAPKPGPTDVALRAPNKPEAAKEPEREPESKVTPPAPRPPETASRPETDAKPDVRSKPSFRPETGKPGDSRDSKATKPDKRAAEFDAMMKSLDSRRRAPKESDSETNAKPERAGAPEHNPARALSISEMDSIRRQLQPCWNMDAAAKNAKSLVVEVHVELERDGAVKDARVTDRGRMARDGAFRAAGEAALRAVQNPRCTPLKLPADRYDRWRTIIIVFDPSRV